MPRIVDYPSANVGDISPDTVLMTQDGTGETRSITLQDLAAIIPRHVVPKQFSLRHSITMPANPPIIGRDLAKKEPLTVAQKAVALFDKTGHIVASRPKETYWQLLAAEVAASITEAYGCDPETYNELKNTLSKSGDTQCTFGCGEFYSRYMYASAGGQMFEWYFMQYENIRETMICHLEDCDAYYIGSFNRTFLQEVADYSASFHRVRALLREEAYDEKDHKFLTKLGGLIVETDNFLPTMVDHWIKKAGDPAKAVGELMASYDGVGWEVDVRGDSYVICMY